MTQSSRRELILQALHLAIRDVPELEGRVWRDRHEAFSRAGMFPAACVLEPLKNESETFRAGLTTMTHTLTVAFAVFINSPTPVQACDPVMVQIHQRVMADMNLGGLVQAINPGPTTWRLEDAGLAIVQANYAVLYRTQYDDLTSA